MTVPTQSGLLSSKAVVSITPKLKSRYSVTLLFGMTFATLGGLLAEGKSLKGGVIPPKRPVDVRDSDSTGRASLTAVAQNTNSG